MKKWITPDLRRPRFVMPGCRLISCAVILMCLFAVTWPTTGFSQDKLISGWVGKENGDPVQNASVAVKGSSIGTTTDANGNFSLRVNPNNTLVISAIGFVNREVQVGQLTSVDIRLIATDKELSEVVVIGYGTQRKRDVTGSVVSVSEAALREVPVANLQMALQGRAAGLEIQKIGSKPGAGAQIRIRGERTINGSNDPLLVLDGIPFEGGNLNDLNPDEVASVEILKDASATAIYGSRGANGVILVTTKKGRPGETRIGYNGYYGISRVTKEYEVFNAEEYRMLRDISPWSNGYMAQELEGIAEGRNTDWQDLMYKNGFITDHNLNVSGGAGGTQFSFGGGFFKETTVLPGQDFMRLSLRASIESRIGKRLRIGLNTINSHNIGNGNQFVNPMFPILTLSPLMPVYDANGNILTSPAGNVDDGNTYNPLLLKQNDNEWVDRQKRIRTFNTLFAEVDIIRGLKYRLNVGLDYRQQESQQFQGQDLLNRPSYFRPGRGNTANVNNEVGWGYTIENILNYERTFNQRHRVTVTGLYSIQEDRTHNTYISKDSIDEDFIQFYNLGQANASNNVKPVVNGAERSWALISYMARINYVFDNRYMLTLTGRIDGSSRLAPGNKWHQYPAVSAGWNISDERFMQGVRFLSNLKIRAGWGETSNQSVNPYASLGLVSPSNGIGGNAGSIRYNYGPTVVSGYNVTALPNPVLDWEYTRTTNIGIDFGLFRNRVTGSIDWYRQHTHNILYGINLPPTSGVAGQFITNIGEMENKGFEFSISTQNIVSTNGFNWSTDLNLFFNRNKLLKLNDGFVRNIANGLHIGYPLTAIYDYNKQGIWQQDEAAAAAALGYIPGQVKLEDISGPDGRPDGIVSPDYDRKIVGDTEADLQGGITNRFSYKGFDLSVVAYARLGGLLISQIHQQQTSYLTINDGKRNGIKVDYWTPTNPSNHFPMPQAQIANATAATAWTTLGYYDASFVRVRSINLGYTFSSAQLKKVGAKSLRTYFTVQNPFILFSPYVNKYGGVDPEATGQGNRGPNGNAEDNSGNTPRRALVISASTPPTTSFILGVNLSF